MISFDIEIHIGLNGRPLKGGRLSIARSHVHNASAFSGSRHIRQMGGHFYDYVGPALNLATLAPSPFDSRQRRFRQMKVKERAPDVTGNIGECVVAIFAEKQLEMTDRDICHLQIRTGMATPDYVLWFNGTYPRYLRNVLSTIRNLPAPPQWIPTESKAVARSSGVRNQVNRAFRQLVSYWDQVKDSNLDSDAVGHGLIVCMKYTDDSPTDGRKVHVFVFAPKSKKSIITYIRSKSRDSLLYNPHSNATLTKHLHG